MDGMRSTVRACVALVCFLGVAGIASATSAGGPRFTSGGPFPGEASCTRCHQGVPNSGSGTLELLAGDVLASEFLYTPGETVSLVVRLSDESAARIGFQLTARSGDGCGQPGSLAVGTSAAGSLVKTVEADCATPGTKIQYATHRRPANGSSADFEVAWTAPTESVGPVTIAVAANGANGDLSPGNDAIYTMQVTVLPAMAPSGPPTISESGVILADLFSKIGVGAPNAIAAAQGTDFAASGSDSSAVVDFTGRVTTNLNGTCVEVNQERAPVFHVLAEQVNFQVPAGTGLGPATVQVIRGCDAPEEARSNLAPFEIAAVQPVFFLWSEDPPVAALHQDWSLVAPADSIPDRESRPAIAGDLITLLGTGFGPVTPPLSSGELAIHPRALASDQLRPLIGEFELTEESIVYAGAAPGFAGLYQLDLLVPDTIPEGAHAFGVLLDGVQSAAGPMLEIALADTGPQDCAVDLVLQPGDTCQTTILGIDAVFAVDDTGRACASAESVSIEFCGEDSLPAIEAFGAAVVKNDNGSWTITKLP